MKTLKSFLTASFLAASLVATNVSAAVVTILDGGQLVTDPTGQTEYQFEGELSAANAFFTWEQVMTLGTTYNVVIENLSGFDMIAALTRLPEFAGGILTSPGPGQLIDGSWSVLFDETFPVSSWVTFGINAADPFFANGGTLDVGSFLSNSDYIYVPGDVGPVGVSTPAISGMFAIALFLVLRSKKYDRQFRSA